MYCDRGYYIFMTSEFQQLSVIHSNGNMKRLFDVKRDFEVHTGSLL